MNRTKLRVALVGCGKIADAHLQGIRKSRRAELVAVCDYHIDLARQAAARFEVPATFTDLAEMIVTARPDVLHVATPPHTHRGIALQAIESGVHLYIEKPFMVDAQEAREVLSAAETHGRLVCAGYDQLFDPSWEDCRGLYRRGDLGRVVHVDSVQGYDLAGPFGKVLTMEPDHWVHDLPGGVFQNVIPHALYRITEFLPDAKPQVSAYWFSGDDQLHFPTELRVQLRGATTTADLMFTSAARPVQRVVRVYGTKQAIEVDLDGCCLRHIRRPKLPGALTKLEIPYRAACGGWRALARNVRRLIRHDLHYFAGMIRLFDLFYQAILEGGESPIPYSEAIRTTAVMDEIFRSCRSTCAMAQTNGRSASTSASLVARN
jgi:predicted dehydrogenase